MSRVLVTGSSGFIGSYLCHFLSNQGHEVFGIDLVAGKNTDFEVDITFPGLTKKIAEFQPETVIHLAAQIDVRESLKNPGFDLLVNGVGTINLIEFSIESNCRNFIYISSGGAIYGSEAEVPFTESHEISPKSPYGLSKLTGEKYVKLLCELHNVNWTSLALSNCFGPLTNHRRGVIYEFAKALKLGEAPKIHGREVTRDFIFVSDVIDAISLAIETPANMRVNISSSTETSLVDLYWKVAAHLEINLKPVLSSVIPGEIVRSSLSNKLAKDIWGWVPKVSLDKGLELALEDFNA